jgi:hypothetical protein
MWSIFRKYIAASLVVVPLCNVVAAEGLKVETKDASLKLGILAQPAYRFDSASTANSNQSTENIFIRRARILVGMNLGQNFEFFGETDSPNMGLATSSAAKTTNPSMYLQDAFVTYKSGMDSFKMDAGLMLPPFMHNSVQGAGTLYSWDYFNNAFAQGTVTQSNVGRDYGVQARGLVMDHLEYRVGAFQGQRNGAGANGFRLAGRLQYNLWDAETGYFYQGTYGGAKKVLSVGVGFDSQNDYRGYAADVFLDYPMGPGVITAQVDYANLDGQTMFATLPQQQLLMAEAGYRFDTWKVSPIFRFEKKSFAAETNNYYNETRTGGGLVYWMNNHNTNMKLFYTHISPNTDQATTLKGSNEVNLQLQLYYF